MGRGGLNGYGAGDRLPFPLPDGLPIPGQVRQQGAPQGGLPALFRRQGAAVAAGIDKDVRPGGPGRQPVGAIDLVLVIEVREALGELKALAPVRVHRQEACQGLVLRPGQDLRQQPHQSPDQARLVEGRGLRHRLAPQHRPIDPPQKTGGQGDLQGGGDSQPALTLDGIGRQGQLEPLGDAVALGQDDLRFQGGQGIAPHPGYQQVTQGLRSVAVDEHQARGQGDSGHVEFLGLAALGRMAKIKAKSGQRLSRPYRGGSGHGGAWSW